MQRGEIYYAELNPVMGCEFGGQQPVVIVQNDYGNRQGFTFIAAPIAKRSEARLPTQVEVTVMNKKAVVMTEQVRTLSGARFISSCGRLSDEDMAKVDQALKVSVGLVKSKRTKALDESLIHRGEIYFADLSHAFGSEQSGLRPVVIIQNDYGNRYSPTTIVAVAVLLIVGIIAGAVTAAMRGDLSILPDSSQDEGSGFLGLKNPGSLKDIDPTTKEELREEFEARPPVTENDIPTFEKNITRYLNEGDFSGLDNYLREQMSTYQTPSEEDEAIDDWSGRFPLLRSDTQIAINLVNKAIDVPAPQFQVFSDPETLAAAILWSPITMKIDAFLDWSSLILPAPAVGSSIQLSEYVYDKPQEKLAEISDSTDTQYYDVRSYNAVVTGHQVRVTVVMGPTGYWLPYSVQDIGGTLTSNNWTKAFLKNELEPNVPYHSDLDEVC